MNLELDTQHKLVRLLRVLETAVHVVGGGNGGAVGGADAAGAGGVAGGGGGGGGGDAAGTAAGGGGGGGGGGGLRLSPRTSLTAFVTGALLIGPAEWAEICPRAVAATTTLAHLRDLLLLVEAKGLGRSPTDAVAACYRRPLDGKRTKKNKKKKNKGSRKKQDRGGGGRAEEDWAGGGRSYINDDDSDDGGGGGGGSGGGGGRPQPNLEAIRRAVAVAPPDSLAELLGAFRDLLEGPLADPNPTDRSAAGEDGNGGDDDDDEGDDDNDDEEEEEEEEDWSSGGGGGGNGNWPPGESLKMYLCFQNADLEDDGWFAQHFPEHLCLAHALHAHLAFAAASSSSSSASAAGLAAS